MSRIFYRSNGRLSARSYRDVWKNKLMIENPRCHACGLELVSEPGQANSAHLAIKLLSCPDHVREVCHAIKVGVEKASADLAHKIEANLERQKLEATSEHWFVDGRPFRTEQRAEVEARRLANLLGSKIEIFVGLLPGNRLRIAQVVVPEPRVNAWAQLATA